MVEQLLEIPEVELDSFGEVDDEPFQAIEQIQKMTSPPKFMKKQDEERCDCRDIMIVDDNLFNIDMLVLLLKRLNIVKVDYTISGLIAEEKVQEKMKKNCQNKQCKFYKIIFMDISMPMQDGNVTAQNINNIYQNVGYQMPIIACSAYEDEQEKRLAANSGMVYYLLKPVKFKELQNVLQTYYN